MSSSYTISETTTFTVTHARHMAAKVATDLKQIQRLYGGHPDDDRISKYEEEAILLLQFGYLKEVKYGFRRNDKWIEPTLEYKAHNLLADAYADDDDPGKIRPGANVVGAVFGSFLYYTQAWHNLSEKERKNFEKRLPIQRDSRDDSDVDGYLSPDRTYSAGGRSLVRSSVRSF